MTNRIRRCAAAFGVTFAIICVGCSASQVQEQPAVGNAAVSKWEGQLIRRPGSSNEDGKVYLVQGGKKRWVISGDWLKQHGYSFPGDVKQVSAEELAAIPTGHVIQ